MRTQLAATAANTHPRHWANTDCGQFQYREARVKKRSDTQSQIALAILT